MAQIGRNDPCPCGSGKKYKRCCLHKASNAEEDQRLRIRRIEGKITDSSSLYGLETYGRKIIEKAWRAFWGRRKEPLDSKHIEFDNLFLNWFTTYWARPSRRGEDDPPLALEWAALTSADNEPVMNYLMALVPRHFSFFQVREVEPDRAMVIRDIFLGEEWRVLERSATKVARPGTILYSRVIPVEGTAILSGTGSVPIPPLRLSILTDMRDSFRKAVGKITAKRLILIEPQLRDMYLLLRDQLLNPAPPKLHNTDGDPFEMIILRYRLEVPVREAVERLSPLTLQEAEQNLLDAKTDAQGQIIKADLTWKKLGNKMHKGWDNTILGHIDIERNLMRVQVNSRARARKIDKEIGVLLGRGIVRLEETAQPASELWEAAGYEKGRESSEGRDQTAELMKNPEIKAKMESMFRQDWEAWPDQPLPALEGLTPRKASKSKKGRELLEALFFDMEHSSVEGLIEPAKAPVAEFRRILGL